MFFDSLDQISEIAKKTSCSIFVVNPETKLNLKNTFYLEKDEKLASISVDQIRDFCSLTNSREVTDHFFVIPSSELMNESAQNAFLKTLEEPKPFCHFVLFTKDPNLLLPTIRSRSQIFYLREQNILDEPPSANPKVMTEAKKLISLSPKDLAKFADTVAKSKPSPRDKAKEITAATIELLYKSYFKTGNTKFLSKLPSLLTLYENLENNCHVKLHLVADLL